MCSLLGYSRQAYYDHQKHHCKQQYEEELVIQEVLRHRRLQGSVGTRKLLLMIKDFTQNHHIDLGRDRFFSLLREQGLLVRARKRKAVTTFSHHLYRKYKNLIRDYSPLAPNLLWVSDITYITTKTGFSYLSLITDAYSRKIVGHCLFPTLAAAGSVKALEMALLNNKTGSNLIHHSDRGIQYCCDDYVSRLNKMDIKISMTENGDPLENAIAERVNGILKTELLQDVYQDFNAAKEGVTAAIEIYNSVRLHSSCDMLTPEAAHLKSGPLKKHWKNYYRKPRNKTELVE